MLVERCDTAVGCVSVGDTITGRGARRLVIGVVRSIRTFEHYDYCLLTVGTAEGELQMNTLQLEEVRRIAAPQEERGA